MKRYLLRKRLLILALVGMLASVCVFVSGVIFLWLDMLDPPNNPLPSDVVFLQRAANYMLVSGFGDQATLYVSAVCAAVLGLFVAVIVDALVSAVSNVIRKQTI